jgi:hypothetical protein
MVKITIVLVNLTSSVVLRKSLVEHNAAIFYIALFNIKNSECNNEI